MTELRALTAAEVGELVGYQPRTIRELALRGRFPMPIDPELSRKLWRWSSVDIDRYRSGCWKPGAAV